MLIILLEELFQTLSKDKDKLIRRELGLERCELVQTLSTNGREEGGSIHSTRGVGLVSKWSSSGYAHGRLRTEEIK